MELIRRDGFCDRFLKYLLKDTQFFSYCPSSHFLRVSRLVKILAAYSFPIYLLDSTVVKYVLLVFYKFIDPVNPLLKLGFLVMGTLLGCWAIIYLLEKFLPKNYRQYILGI